ncbi:hypothetical protein [Ramlibacter sp. Leaf400]|uniref:hypothetical protein n=1 Tax=Ramlibacter sp. Leaf400 TaxID=1736365 RepID=UPI0006FFA0B9|nr:hypothetical protein [Ramlibacter sp. Leaf400]KQT14294.1 hypothetical protein ASG30_01545 [Ramlibacter sp. Leaf400]
MTYGELLQRALGQGMAVERALEFLRGSGASPAEAARAIQETIGASVDEARDLVARTRAWSAPRSGVQLPGRPREGYGAIGQHGRSGHGAASVLPHLVRQAQSHAGSGKGGGR